MQSSFFIFSKGIIGHQILHYIADFFSVMDGIAKIQAEELARLVNVMGLGGGPMRPVLEVKKLHF